MVTMVKTLHGTPTKLLQKEVSEDFQMEPEELAVQSLEVSEQ